MFQPIFAQRFITRKNFLPHQSPHHLGVDVPANLRPTFYHQEELLATPVSHHLGVDVPANLRPTLYHQEELLTSFTLLEMNSVHSLSRSMAGYDLQSCYSMSCNVNLTSLTSWCLTETQPVRLQVAGWNNYNNF